MSFTGCYTAIITPFQNGQIDYDSYAKIIEAQIAGGVDGIVAAGTTGESPTINMKDHSDLIRFTVKQVADRCKVIAGSGANSTAEAIELTQNAERDGAHGSLQVTPYYNKPTQNGLYQHFKTVAENTSLPIMLYNVPGRSGVEIAIDTAARLSEVKNITCIKEAAGCVDRVSALQDVCDLTVLSGDDSLTLPMISVGAKGVVSVISNVLPAEMTQLTHAALKGDYAAAIKMHKKIYPLMKNLFIESNPMPVKTLMASMGYCIEEFRLPMCAISPENKELLLATAKQVGIQL